MKQALLIFVKNAVKGKVKTRLAATVGDEIALNVYENLLKHTENCTHLILVHKIVCYADFIADDDVFSNDDYEKQIQKGNDLGERMQNSIDQAFKNGYEQIVIIGSDCFELTHKIIEHAYTQLTKNDVVIGPALDGGYYLLGMKKIHKSLFQNIKWSTNQVLNQTLKICLKIGLKVIQLQKLSDIDTEDDLKRIGYKY